MEDISEYTVWRDRSGKNLVIKDLSDDHLNNVLWFIRKQMEIGYKLEDYEAVCLAVAKSRGMDLQEIGRKQIPHINAEGKRVLFNPDTGLDEEV